MAAIKTLGYKCEMRNKIPFPIEIHKALEFKNQGQMNPLKLVNCLIGGMEIYEDSRVIKIRSNVAYTEKNQPLTTRYYGHFRFWFYLSRCLFHRMAKHCASPAAQP